MSERIVHEWQPSLKKAFNTRSSEKGERAEELFKQYAISKYYKVIHLDADREKQNEGIDFLILKNEIDSHHIRVDVKANLFRENFYIDNWNSGWLRTKKSDLIVHIDIDNHQAIEYNRKLMLERMDSPNKFVRQLLKFHISDININDLLKVFTV